MFSLAVKEEGQSGWSVGGEPLPVLVAVVFWSVGFGLGGSILSGLDVHFSSEPLNNFKNLWDAGHTAHLFIVGAVSDPVLCPASADRTLPAIGTQHAIDACDPQHATAPKSPQAPSHPHPHLQHVLLRAHFYLS